MSTQPGYALARVNGSPQNQGRFRLGVIVLAYKLPAQLRLLLTTLQHPEVRIYLHVDKGVRFEPFRTAASTLGVTFLRRYRSYWGSAGCVDAILEGLRVAYSDGCDYILTISGQDLPLVPIADIVRFFAAHRTTSYLRYWPIHETNSPYRGIDRTDFYAYTLFGRREVCVPWHHDSSYLSLKGQLLNTALRLWSLPKGRRSFPHYVRPMMGDTWWNINRDAALYVLEFVANHEDYRRYHEHTLTAEEVFFSSILGGTAFPGQLESESLRYIVAAPGWHPKVLTTLDLPAVMQSGKLFARKFDLTVDSQLVDRVVSTHYDRPT